MASGKGTFDLKTKTGRLLLGDYIQNKYNSRKWDRWQWFITQTLTQINVKKKCGNYHNMIKPSHWKCNCD